jgi:hypothetical protein
VTVTATKKSHASVSQSWFRRHAHHVCDDEPGRDGTGRRLERLTVRGETTMPSRQFGL